MNDKQLLRSAIEVINICELVLQIAEDRKLDLPIAATLVRINLFKDNVKDAEAQTLTNKRYD